MRYLGIDYGSSKVGLALSDEAGVMGFPYAVVTNTPRLVDELINLIEEKKVGAVVVGESCDFAGNENPIAEHARALAQKLSERAGVPIFFEFETLTTAQARRAPEKADKTRAVQRRVNVDASAAAIILTSYLSHTHHG